MRFDDHSLQVRGVKPLYIYGLVYEYDTFSVTQLRKEKGALLQEWEGWSKEEWYAYQEKREQLGEDGAKKRRSTADIDADIGFIKGKRMSKTEWDKAQDRREEWEDAMTQNTNAGWCSNGDPPDEDKEEEAEGNGRTAEENEKQRQMILGTTPTTDGVSLFNYTLSVMTKMNHKSTVPYLIHRLLIDLFHDLDMNKNGAVTRAEFIIGLKKHPDLGALFLLDHGTGDEVIFVNSNSLMGSTDVTDADPADDLLQVFRHGSDVQAAFLARFGELDKDGDLRHALSISS